MKVIGPTEVGGRTDTLRVERTSGVHPGGAIVTPDFHHAPDSLEALTSALWRERELLDDLLFALSCQRLLLESGSLRWLATSSSQVRALVDALREQEILRSMVTEGLTTELAQPAGSLLSQLVDLAPEPYPVVLGDLLAVLRELADEVAQAVRCNDKLLLGLAHRSGSDGAP